jgi:histidyl-tRNA synthetase
VLADAEIAQVIHSALADAGVPDFTITLNSRKILDGMLESLGLSGRTGSVLRSLDKLAKIGRGAVRVELNKPAEAGGAGLTEEQAGRVVEFAETGRGGVEVLREAEAALGSNAHAGQGIANLRTVLDLLDASGIPQARIAVDLGLARGLDYYTGIVFETTIKGWEKFGSVASGGRYDDLASLFTSRRLPGVGASIGLDRLLALMDEAGWLKGATTATAVLVANFPGTDPVIPFRMAARLRNAGIGAEIYPEPIQIGKQMGYGSSRGHRLAVIVGPDEAAREVFNLRNLATRQEDKGLAWSVLEDSVQSALEIISQEGSGA